MSELWSADAPRHFRSVGLLQLRSHPMSAQTGEAPYFITTTCPTCGSQVDGITGFYCTCCGWVSPPEGEPPAGE